MKKFLFGILGLLFAIPAVADLDPCRNLFDKDAMIHGAYVFEDGTEKISAQYCYSNYIPVTPGQTYTFSAVRNLSAANKRIHAYDSNKNWIQQLGLSPSSSSVGPYAITVTIPSGISYILISGMVCDVDGADTNMQLEQGSTATEYVPFCANQIKIATTAYNSARFSPVVTELNDTIATIRSVVTNTINQTKAIADLQATKQTRPDETCPAGKKCLLVEDDDGTPHWYEIIESASLLPDGFTELQYIESTGTQYIDTGIMFNPNKNFRVVGSFINPDASTRKIILGNYYDKISTTYYSVELYNDGKFRNYLASKNSTITSSFSPSPLPANTLVNFNTYYNATNHTITNSLSYNGTVQNYSAATISPINTAEYSLKLFNDARVESSNVYNAITLGIIEIYENDILKHKYIPAKNSSNVVGMYDTVSGQFFTNAGSGTFTAGPEI